jgi:RNA polymerase sigma factor (sigma-70 family)
MLWKRVQEGDAEGLWKTIPPDLWTWIEKYTERKAKRVGRAFELNAGEVADLHQELMIDVARRWRRYDPARSPEKAFVALLIKHRIADFCDNGIRRVRDPRQRAVSLNDTVRGQDDEPVERSRLVSEADTERLTHYRRPSRRRQFDMEQDVRCLVAKLPPDLRRICEALMHYNPRVAAQRLKIPESTLRDKLKGLRIYFARLADYLDVPAS